jgi:hypothetical protein
LSPTFFFSLFYHQEKETNGNTQRNSRPPGCSPYQAHPHWCMGSLRGPPNRFPSHNGHIKIEDTFPDSPDNAPYNAHVQGYTQHQTSPDASSRIFGGGSHRIPYTRHFLMVRRKAVGDSLYAHESFPRYSGQLLHLVRPSLLPSSLHTYFTPRLRP